MNPRRTAENFPDRWGRSPVALAAAGVGLLAAALGSARADVVDIPASQDATLLGGTDAATNNSLADPGIFVGTDGQGNPKRGLVEFNVSAAIPAGAVVTDAELELTVGQVAGSGGGVSGGGSGPETMGLFDETQPWQQPTNFTGATSFGGHGHGAAPDAGDATWNCAFYGSAAWNLAGGNWTTSSTDLADAQVLGTLGYVATWSSAAMVADVQKWADNPATNDGWLIKNSDEADPTDFRAFWSWQGAANTGNPAVAPELVVTYTTTVSNLTWYGLASANGDGKTWDIGNNTNWNNGTSLSAYTDGSNVTFDNSLVTSDQTIVLNTSVSPASVTFNNSTGSYTITGGGGITGSAGLTKTGGQRVMLATVNSYTGGTVVNAGTLELAVPGALPAGGPLTIAAGGRVVADAGTGLLTLGGLNLDPSNTGSPAGLLDLGNNGLVVKTGGIAAITADIRAAADNLTWNGAAGITSSTAAADSRHLTAVGAIQNNGPDGGPVYTTAFDGVTGLDLTTADVLARYTRYGDANLDGVVDGSDYSLIDNGYANHLTGWQNGDFNYDGVIDGTDYALIDNAFNNQTGGLAGSNAAVEAVSETAVPEPAGLFATSIVGAAFGSRRRRRGRRSTGFTLVQLLVVIAILAVLAAVLIPMARRLHDQADLARCKDNLRQIGICLSAYARSDGGAYPVSAAIDNPHADLLHCLGSPGPAPDPQAYYCPAEHRAALAFSRQNFNSGVIGYYYFSARRLGPTTNPAMSKFLRSSVSWPRQLKTGMDPKTWVMSDIWVSSEPTAHAAYKKGVNYLMLDGGVGFVTESPRQQFR
jgi:autotransporter-associated beta strand protein